MNPADQGQRQLRAAIDTCIATLSTTPQWRDLHRAWLACRASAPTLGPSSADMLAAISGTAMAADMEAYARTLLDGALHHNQDGKKSNAREVAAESLLRDLSPELLSVTVRQLLFRMGNAPPNTITGPSRRGMLWRVMARGMGIIDADRLGPIMDAAAAIDVLVWIRRVSGQFSQVFLALSETYPHMVTAPLMMPCMRLYANVLCASSLPPAGICMPANSVQQMWSSPWACSPPEYLLARVCIVVGTVIFASSIMQDPGIPKEEDADGSDFPESDLMPAAVIVVLTLMTRTKKFASRTQATHLVHVALGSSNCGFAGPSAAHMEQCLRIAFIGILPWSCALVFLDLVLTSDNVLDSVEDILSVMADMTGGDSAKLGSLPGSTLTSNLSPLLLGGSTVVSHHPSAGPRAMPGWLQAAIAASSGAVASHARLEELADGIAFTQQRTRLLIQRWQRVSRGVGIWRMYMSAVRSAVRDAHDAQAAAARALADAAVAQSAADAKAAAAMSAQAKLQQQQQQAAAANAAAATAAAASAAAAVAAADRAAKARSPLVSPSAKVRADANAARTFRLQAPLAALVTMVADRVVLGGGPPGSSSAAGIEVALARSAATTSRGSS
ncbi:hypothetical protein BC828DRAFT_375496 [Blastocladiella britannica]|nr:hypothetical protein BC828DRAFT_375496 [Blastocladiella britannica]